MKIKHLFTDRKIYDLTSSHISSLESKIKKMTRSDFNNSTIEELTEKLKTEFEISVPELSKDEIYTKQPKDIKITIRRRGVYGGGATKVDGTEFMFVIPFNGNSHYFEITPTKFLSIVPYGNARNNEISISYKIPNRQNSSGLREEFDNNLAIIEKYLGFLDSDFKQFNNQLASRIITFLKNRKAKLDSDDKTVGGFGFPVK
ncbi:hypothetical protein [uncultured Tenacibaculum sp.]|uniref:hypothetical protein n=1 Tax=uncultured Tenacibaculum sp. TaxID=174713 RepID=UPI00261D2C04|nr:hypothetical protein [uncultured Tenacibaculum sp.]